MYRLTYQDGDTPQIYTFATGEVMIGRSPDCQVVLKDFGISRSHAQIMVDEDGRPHRRSQVQERDPGQRGSGGRGPAQGRRPDPARQVPDPLHQDPRGQGRPRRGQAALRGGGDHHPQRRRALAPALRGARRRGRPADGKKAPAVDVREIEKSNRILKVLTKVAETLIAVRPVEEVLQQVMDIVFDHIPADRGFLMLAGREPGRAPRPHGGQAPQPAPARTQGKITISKTIADRVMQGPRLDPHLGRPGRPALRRRRLDPLPRDPQRHVRAPVERRTRSSGSSTSTPRCSPTASPERPRPAHRARQLRGGGRGAGPPQPEDRGRGEEARAARPLPLAPGDEPDPRRLRLPGAELGAPEVRDVTVLFADIVRLHEHVGEDEPGRGGAPPERLPLAHDRRDLQVRGNPRQVHRRRHHGGLRRAPRHARPRRAGRAHRARDAGAPDRVQRRAQGGAAPAGSASASTAARPSPARSAASTRRSTRCSATP